MEKILSREEIEALFSAMSSADPRPGNRTANAESPRKIIRLGSHRGDRQISPLIQSNFERLMMADTVRPLEPETHKAAGSPEGAAHGVAGNWNIDLLLDVELPLSVSFGQTEMPLREVLKLGAGSVIELEKSANDTVTVAVNQKPIATGEVVMMDGNYGVRILEVKSTADRIRSLA